MGDPKKTKPKAETPRKVWDADRIREESALKTEYGLKNTREVWTALYELKRVRRTARKLLSLGDEGEKQGAKLVAKLRRIGVSKGQIKLEDILALNVRDFLERRLQTLVLKKGLARTPKQARQLITHGFVSVSARRVNIPSYIVTVDEEPTISYFKAIDISPPSPAPKKTDGRKAGGAEEGAPKEEHAPKAAAGEKI